MALREEKENYNLSDQLLFAQVLLLTDEKESYDSFTSAYPNIFKEDQAA